MAKWYNAYLTGNETRKQVGQKGILARQRKQEATANAKSIAKAGIASNAKQSVKQEDTRGRIANAMKNFDDQKKNRVR